MSFKYINPGYAKFLVCKTSSSLTQYTNTEKSRTGVAFRNYRTDNGNYINLSDKFSGEDFWGKFDFYYDLSQTNGYEFQFGELKDSYYMSLQNGISIGLGSYIVRAYLSATSSSIISSNYAEFHQISGLKPNAINSIWLHIKYGSLGEGFIEFQINNKKSDPIKTKAVNRYSNSNFHVCLDSWTSAADYFSSVIISDEEISPNERVVALPISNTVSDMDSLPSGLYTADTAGETLLQSPNISALIADYGSNTNVTGIAMIGNPAYQVDDIIGNVTSLSKENNVVTEHDNITLLTDTDAMIVSSFSLASNTTIADLSNMQFGWRSEE